MARLAGGGLDHDALRRLGKSSATREVFLNLVNGRLRRHNPLADIAAFDAFRSEGNQPVHAFADWLRHDPKPRNVFDPFNLFEAAATATSEDPSRMAGIMEFLAGSDLCTVKVVHQAGMTEGLRALATHIIYNGLLEEKWGLADREVCYLPVNRTPGTNERITFPKLVGYLHQFYCPDASSPDQPPNDAESLRDALQDIREAMTRKGAILVLDGHSALRSSVRDLRALVADDALTALLRETLHPLIGKTAASQDPGVFYKNRFLILADHPLPGLEAFQHDPLDLPHVDKPDHVRRILQSQGREYVAELETVYQQDAMKSDAAMALADSVITLRIRRGVQSTARTAQLTTPRTAFDALMAELMEQPNPVALFALRAAAISDGGVRYMTLAHLVDQWRELAKAARLTAPAHVLPELDHAQVAEKLESLGAILLHGLDEDVPGLDDVSEPYVFLDERAWSGASLDRAIRRQSFDLRSSELREVIVEQFLNEEPQAAMLLHRIFAEEGLRQQTLVMRHAEWRGTADVRYYRRLVQTLFHGFASLSLGPKHGAPMADSVPVVLPAKPASAYRRLYSVFLRTLLEHPPHFDLSRSLGRDRLKTELILLAMNADRRPSTMVENLFGAADSLEARTTAFLKQDEHVAASREILLDQHLSLARAQYQIDRLAAAQKTLDRIQDEDIITSRPAETHEADQRRARKIALDIGIQLKPREQKRKIEQALELAGFGSDLLLVLDALKDAAGESARAKAPDQRAEDLLKDAADAFVAAHCTLMSAEDLAYWSDLLCRRAEVDALMAEGLTAEARRINERAEARRINERYAAFTTFYLAERIRREAFDREPMGRSYVVNGHATRMFARIALQLVRGLREVERRSAQRLFAHMPGWRYFVMLARRHIDLLTRYSARYPSERPSLLILEATFTRSVGGLDTAKLLAALELLKEADQLMFTTPDRPRVRRRLLLERTKVLRALATAARESTDASEHGAAVLWWRLATFDVVRLGRLTPKGGQVGTATTLWEIAAADQVDWVRRMRSTLGLHRASTELVDRRDLADVLQ